MNNKEIGELGERKAENFLLNKGYKILFRNFRCKLGEIDLIAQDKDYIVFVEVKARNTIVRGYPQESVNAYKQRQLIKSAMFYMQKNGMYDCNCRFDVVAILFDKLDCNINHIENAFEVMS